jgi:hypothetical protein
MFLNKLEGKFSEHVRRAIDQYIQKLTDDNTSASRSKKEGELNG